MYTLLFVCTWWICLFLDDWSFCKTHCTEAATTVRSLSFHPDSANKSPKTTARQGLGLPICARSAAYKSNNPLEIKITRALHCHREEECIPVKVKNRVVHNGFPGRDDDMPDRVVIQGLRGPEKPRVCLQEGKHHPGSNLQQEELDHKAPDDNHDQGEYHQPVEELVVVLLDEKST